jgi:hypothetical protein
MNNCLVPISKLTSSLVLASLLLIPRALLGADIRPATPVTVEGPVSVQGVVEVINDAMRQPYVRTVFVSASDQPVAEFDIPDGKRLIIEMVAFQAGRAPTDLSRMFLQPLIGTQRQLIPMPIQSTVDDPSGSTTYMISMISLKLRIDSVPGSGTEIQIRRGAGGVSSMFATVSGYLVDL